MEMKERLSVRLGARDIKGICQECGAGAGAEMREAVFECIDAADERTAYNALWVLTHLPRAHREWLASKRDGLIDRVLRTTHTGRTRLLLTILEDLPVREEDVRTDFLDFCLTKINSTEPYAIRALSLKHAFAQCRFYPELLGELRVVIEIMGHGELPPGLRCARRNILKKMERLSANDRDFA